jgi:predicted phosphoadenosine phosphosulfate sulfurtransferase
MEKTCSFRRICATFKTDLREATFGANREKQSGKNALMKRKQHEIE